MDNDKPVLLPCPFCGGEANFEQRLLENGWIVRCDRRFLPNADNQLCAVNMRTHCSPSKEDAANMWNTRCPAPAAAWVAISERLPIVEGFYLTQREFTDEIVNPGTKFVHESLEWFTGDSFVNTGILAWLDDVPPYRPAVEAEGILTPDA